MAKEMNQFTCACDGCALPCARHRRPSYLPPPWSCRRQRTCPWSGSLSRRGHSSVGCSRMSCTTTEAPTLRRRTRSSTLARTRRGSVRPGGRACSATPSHCRVSMRLGRLRRCHAHIPQTTPNKASQRNAPFISRASYPRCRATIAFVFMQSPKKAGGPSARCKPGALTFPAPRFRRLACRADPASGHRSRSRRFAQRCKPSSRTSAAGCVRTPYGPPRDMDGSATRAQATALTASMGAGSDDPRSTTRPRGSRTWS